MTKLRCAALFNLFASMWTCSSEQVLIDRFQTEPVPGQPQYIEVFNNTSNPFDIAEWKLSGGAAFAFPGFDPQQPRASFLRPFERIVLTSADPATARSAYHIPDSVRVFGPWSGNLKHKKDQITLADKNGVPVCAVKYGSNGLWPRPEKASGQAFLLVDPNGEVNDWRNWSLDLAKDNPPGTPPLVHRTTAAPSPQIEVGLGRVLVDYGAYWLISDSGREPGAHWQTAAFGDRAWRRGRGLFGYDTKPLPEPGLRTRLPMNRQITYYFRSQFICPVDVQPGDRLVLDQIVDDGAIYYLNGKEAARSRMPAGPVHATTLATSTIPTADEEMGVFNLDLAGLQKGTNAFAVEVHQCSVNSSDVVFGMRLRLVGPAPAGCVINEVSANHSTGFIEVFNNADSTQNLKGCFLSADLENLRQTPITKDLAVPAHGLAVIELPKPVLRKTGPLTFCLTASDGVTVLDAITVNFAADGRPLGRAPDGGKRWFRFSENSPGAPNSPAGASITLKPNQNDPGEKTSRSDIVINELMYDPPFGAEGTEFVELFNRGAHAVDLSAWSFDQGIEFTFPEGFKLDSGAYLVLAANQNKFRAAYEDVPVAGQFKGRLRHSGELLQLVDRRKKVMAAVDFRAGGDWPSLGHGGGSSLELLHPQMDGAKSSAWRDSIEESKGIWSAYSCTNTYLELKSLGRPSDFRELQLYLAGAGHVALRNIGLFHDGTNYLDHPERMSSDGSSAHGWLAQGTHASSYLSNGELHVVSDGRGDNRADRLEIDCVRLRRGERYELRFEARWISGCPRLVAHTWDRSLGSSFLIAIPANPGSPGRLNSVASPPPFTGDQPPLQLDNLHHSPPVPSSSDPVHVTVQVAGGNPIATVRLWHRKDSADGKVEWISKAMTPVTEGPASVQGEYAADLTEHQENEEVVQFYVEAEAQNGKRVTLPRAGADRPALYVVDDRKLQRDGRLDRFVISAYDLSSIRDGGTAQYGFRQPRLSNHRYNMTFISNEETVFYGGAIRVSGSPFTRGRDLGKAKWELPGDRPFRGRTKFYFDNDSNFHNRICRYLLYQLGHVASEAEWVRVIVNTSGPFLREDTEPVTGEFLDRVFPDGNHGELYRFDDQWWFADDWERDNQDAAWSYKGTDDPLYYRTDWQKHTREVEDDFSTLIRFFKLYDGNRYSQQEIEQYLDSNAILQMAATRGYIGDWDSFTMFRGKNGYFFRRPADGRFQFLQWDSDLAFREGNYPFYSDRVARWLERPYNRAVFQKQLAQLAQFTESPRWLAWLELETAAVPERPVNAEFYRAFFKQRNEFLKSTGGRVR